MSEALGIYHDNDGNPFNKKASEAEKATSFYLSIRRISLEVRLLQIL